MPPSKFEDSFKSNVELRKGPSVDIANSNSNNGTKTARSKRVILAGSSSGEEDEGIFKKLGNIGRAHSYKMRFPASGGLNDDEGLARRRNAAPYSMGYSTLSMIETVRLERLRRAREGREEAEKAAAEKLEEDLFWDGQWPTHYRLNGETS